MVIRTIKLTSLFVNTENYRFEPLSSQKEAIDKMIEDQGDKLYSLVDDIVTNVWGIERSGFFNGREKWAKGFENQRV